MPDLTPFFKDVQAHYDLSEEFYGLFLDPTQTYSCAYFKDPEMSLEEAQLAKIDLSLGKCDLQAGCMLLDIGCGWGSTVIRAAQKYDVRAIGLTLSHNQLQTARRRLEESGLNNGQVEFRLQGWEEFGEPVDRIISIGAFEHFRKERHTEFFSRCRALLPEGGRMLLHTIVVTPFAELKRLGIEVTEEDVTFGKFIRREIFPGGQLVTPVEIEALAAESGFSVLDIQALGPHYIRTLDMWAENLCAARDEAEQLTSPAIVARYEKYLTGCAALFRKRTINVMQFQLERS